MSRLSRICCTGLPYCPSLICGVRIVDDILYRHPHCPSLICGVQIVEGILYRPPTMVVANLRCPDCRGYVVPASHTVRPWFVVSGLSRVYCPGLPYCQSLSCVFQIVDGILYRPPHCPSLICGVRLSRVYCTGLPHCSSLICGVRIVEGILYRPPTVFVANLSCPGCRGYTVSASNTVRR